MSQNMELRKYQTDLIDKIRAIMRNGTRRVILQASCGSGKTLVGADIVRSALEKGSNVLFLVNRRDLVKQTVQKFQDFGLGEYVGVIMAGEQAVLSLPVQVASLQTYVRRLKLDDLAWNSWYHKANLVILDECHVANARTYREILDIYKDDGAYILGLSATPTRSDGTGLGEVFQEIVTCIGIDDLIEQGFLVPMIYYAPSTPDLAKIKITAGDYNQKELGERVDLPKLVGDIYENWARLASDRQTIIFATNVKHSKHIRDLFERNGVAIEHIDAHTGDEDREGIYSRFENGDTQVLTNVGICTEGSDLPFVTCVVIARPTKSLGRWLQMAGRGLRPYEKKESCLLLDHAGCVAEHGLIEDPVEWTLDGKKRAVKKRKKREKEKKLMTCAECSFVFTGPVCPQCGTRVRDYGKKIETTDDDLVEVGKRKKIYTMLEKSKWWQMFEYERRRLGKSEKWLLAQYKSKFGVWPRGMDGLGPIEPDKAVLNWLKYQRIKWAKGKQAAERKIEEREMQQHLSNMI